MSVLVTENDNVQTRQVDKWDVSWALVIVGIFVIIFIVT